MKGYRTVLGRNPFIYSVTKWIGRLVFSVFYRVELKKENTISVNEPAIILPKHQYWTDIPLVSLSFRFPLYFVAKKELFRYPWIRPYLSSLGGISLDRDRSINTLTSFRYLFSRLRAAEKIVIFPEGTYFRDRVGSGKSRLIRMILRFQSKWKKRIPFIPVGIRYGERRTWRRRVEIRIGHPLFAEGESEAISLTSRIMEEIGRLSRLPRC